MSQSVLDNIFGTLINAIKEKKNTWLYILQKLCQVVIFSKKCCNKKNKKTKTQ